MPSTVTPEQVGAYIRVLKVVADTIKELKEVPSGPLYAMLMDVVPLQTYTAIIDTLKRLKQVKESNHLLTWIGQEPEAK